MPASMGKRVVSDLRIILSGKRKVRRVFRDQSVTIRARAFPELSKSDEYRPFHITKLEYQIT